MTTRLRVGVVGFGSIGRRHADWIGDRPDCTLAGVADPSAQSRSECEVRSVFWTADHRELLDRVDAVVIATPNHLHLPAALDCFERRLPVLIEKPLAETAEAAVNLAVEARRAGSPTLVGYYRRHHPAIREARRAVLSGELGRIVTANFSVTFLKPKDYFGLEWRRIAGGGPVLINAVHDIDALRHLVGEITSVQALLSSAARGYEVEDSAGMLFQFEGGAIGTVIVSDAVPSPYSWDLNAAEYAVLPVCGKGAYVLGGERASLSLPDMRVWRYDGSPGWREPLTEGAPLGVAPENPYVAQWSHFARVARGEEAPLVSAEDAARTQIVAEAVLESGRSGARIALADRYAALERALRDATAA